MISPPGSRPSRRAGTCRRNSTTRQGSQHMDGDGGTPSQSPDLDAKLWLTRTYRPLVRGTNINATSLLATDHLNHFNAVVTVLALVPDMPDIDKEAPAWKHTTHTQHFPASVASHRVVKGTSGSDRINLGCRA